MENTNITAGRVTLRLTSEQLALFRSAAGDTSNLSETIREAALSSLQAKNATKEEDKNRRQTQLAIRSLSSTFKKTYTLFSEFVSMQEEAAEELRKSDTPISELMLKRNYQSCYDMLHHIQSQLNDALAFFKAESFHMLAKRTETHDRLEMEVPTDHNFGAYIKGMVTDGPVYLNPTVECPDPGMSFHIRSFEEEGCETVTVLAEANYDERFKDIHQGVQVEARGSMYVELRKDEKGAVVTAEPVLFVDAFHLI